MLTPPAQWPFWCDTHISGPVKRSTDGTKVTDRYGEPCAFYTDVPGILSAIKQSNIGLGAASRTSAPDIARDLLRLLTVPHASASVAASTTAPTALSLFDHLEIYPGTKTTHFRSLQKKSGLPFEEMLFFDDEARNRNVEQLGVIMYLVIDGVTAGEVDKGIRDWRRRNGRTAKETEAEAETEPSE